MNNDILTDTSKSWRGLEVGLIKKQVERELASVIDGVDRFERQQDRMVFAGNAGDTKPARKASRKYVEKLTDIITDYMGRQEAAKRRKSKIYNLLGRAQPIALAEWTISTILSEVAKQAKNKAILELVDPNKEQTSETELNLLQNAVAFLICQRINNERHLSVVLRENPEYFKRLMNFKDAAGNQKSQDDLEEILKKITDIPAMEQDWTDAEKLMVGHALLEFVIESGFVTEGYALKEVTITKYGLDDEAVAEGRKKVGDKKVDIKTPLTLTLSEDVQDNLDALLTEASLMRPALRPMVCKPRDWTTPLNGGYFTHRVPIVKRWISDDHKAAVMGASMPKVYQAVNAIQSIPWEINERMLEVIQWAYDEEISLKGLVGDGDTSTTASRKDARAKVKQIKENLFNRTPDDLADIMAPYKKASLKDTTTLALRIQTKKAIGIAHDLKKERFWFPHNLDYRGRAYPLPETFNPQATKPIKSLMHFADKGEPLVDTGKGSSVYWLKMHLATCAGYDFWEEEEAGVRDATDKATMDERVKWTEDNQELITNIITNWKGNIHLWKGYDDPCGFLAAAFELVAFWNKKDGEKVYSQVPLYFDGSCSGAQHVAALFKDEKGAKAVNLVPELLDDTKPASSDNLVEVQIRHDIYEKVMKEAVKQLIKLNPQVLDGKEGDKKRDVLATGITMAKMLTRTVCKRPCMTYYYGADHVGFTGQVKDQLKDVHFKVRQKIADFIFRAIEVVCPGAKKMRDWIQGIAKTCAKFDRAMIWTTPDGLPVEHLAFKTKSKKVDYFITTTKGDKKRGSGNFVYDLPKISPIKMKNGSSPNLVHSLDATHLRMVAKSAFEKGMPVAVIHDCFGTNATNASKLFNLIRVEFVSLYEDDENGEGVLTGLMKDFKVTKFETPIVRTLKIADIRFTEFSFA